MTILVLGDDGDSIHQITTQLQNEGHDTESSDAALFSENAALDLAIVDQTYAPSFTERILNLIRLESYYKKLPIIVLSSDRTDTAVIQAFDLGADDFMPKPFLWQVFLKRMNAIVRRCGVVPNAKKFFAQFNLLFDFENFEVKVNREPLPLTLTEFKILKEMVGHANRVAQRLHLQQEVFGNCNVTARTLDVHICSLRKKLRAQGLTVESLRGVGYRLKAVTL